MAAGIIPTLVAILLQFFLFFLSPSLSFAFPAFPPVSLSLLRLTDSKIEIAVYDEINDKKNHHKPIEGGEKQRREEESYEASARRLHQRKEDFHQLRKRIGLPFSLFLLPFSGLERSVDYDFFLSLCFHGGERDIWKKKKKRGGREGRGVWEFSCEFSSSR